MPPELGQLVDVDVREIWPQEGRDFTPWLAENLDLLGEALGLRLELEGTELAVEGFAADILARDITDGTKVLIENQLTRTDHRHLGQILTYLAGLNARKVIWIAPEFHAAHLSAIHWLNEHTDDDHAFFAVRLRVVRIGDSAPAPVFEVLARPSEWERQLAEHSRQSGYTKEAEIRFAYWRFYLERHPQAAAAGLVPNRHWSQWLPVCAVEGLASAIQVVLSIGKTSSGIFVRGGWGEDKHSASRLLEPHLPVLHTRLGLPENHYRNPAEGHVFGEFRPLSCLDEAHWPELADWQEERRQAYTCAIREVLDCEAV